MALIKCSECGREISDKATACPGCGCPVNFETSQEKSDYEKLVDKIYLEYMLGNTGEARTHDQRAKAIQALRSYSGVSTKKATDDLWMRAFGKTHTQMRAEQKAKNKEDWARLKNNWNNSTQAISGMANLTNPSKTPHCPKCRSTSISYDTKKLSIGRAIVGDAIAGAPGAVIGGLSSKKGYAVCLNCGKRWKI